jgi:signal peptidase I
MAFFGGAPQDSDQDKQERAEEMTSAPLPGVGQPLEAYPGYEPESAPSSSAVRRARRLAWEVAQTLLLAALIFFAVRAMAQNFRVEGSSMEPGLHNGQFLLVNKAIYLKINLKTLSKYLPFIHPGDQPVRFLFRGPRRGDVIVFRFPQDPSRDFIKRVIGVPGDEVEVRSGSVFVNGIALDEPYVTSRAEYSVPRQVVPKGQYFVLGDNRNNSYDSHIWGMVPEDNIIGQAMFSYWPLSDFGGAGNRNINLGLVRLPLP